jgi:hypothetical protein
VETVFPEAEVDDIMRLFLNIRRTKGAIWAMNVIAILCIMFVFVAIFQKQRAGVFKPRPTEAFKKKLQSGASDERIGASREANLMNYAALWEARIDGSLRKDRAEEAAAANVDAGPRNEPLENVLGISMILHTPGTPEESKVRLVYLKEVNQEVSITRHLWSEEGDPLKPPYDADPCLGKVIKIEESEVVFSWFGEEVSLGPKSFVSAADKAMARAGGGEGFPEDPLKRFRNNPPQETEEYQPDHYALSENEYKQVSEGYEKLLDEISLTSTTNPDTGKKSIKLGSVNEDSLVYRRGFRGGDVLISINGFPISTRAGAINYFKQHPDEGRYIVEIDRMGRRIYKTFIYDNQ